MTILYPQIKPSTMTVSPHGILFSCFQGSSKQNDNYMVSKCLKYLVSIHILLPVKLGSAIARGLTISSSLLKFIAIVNALLMKTKFWWKQIKTGYDLHVPELVC
jgi:hypothetical protein